MNNFSEKSLNVRIVLAIALLVFSVFIPIEKAKACGTCTLQALSSTTTAESLEWTTPGIGDPAGTYPRLTQHLDVELGGTEAYLISVFWEDNVLPALMLMADQLTATAMKQMQIVGSFMDAKQQMETQQVFQRLAARAHKDYHPSTGMCEFGSSAKSLAASERKGELNALVLGQRFQGRALGATNTAAATGEDGDKDSRLKQFREKFCDPHDNNDGLGYLCEHDQDKNTANSALGAAVPGGMGTPNVTPVPPPAGPGGPPYTSPRKNKDIDYTRTVDFPWTLDMDFTDTTLKPDEEDVMALANNLYGHEVFARPNFDNSPNKFNTMKSRYMDARALIAKQSVAENSFNAIAAMKSAGTPGSRDYLVELMKQLTSPTPTQQQGWDINNMLGANPSYYAQMEVLTKKIYQNPDFYTNLYDTPANVSRKGVAMQAIGLMQKFDLYKSYLRNEASLSVLLELAVQDLQDEVENKINDR